MLTFKINKNDAGQRADKFLLKATAAPASLIYKTFRKKDVKVNKKWVKESHILVEGDELSAYISDQFAKANREISASSVVNVVYEDENIAVLNKPKGLPSQPDKDHADALSESFKAYLIKTGAYSPDEESSFSPALCNRLDTNTAGLVIGAKNAVALREMNAAIKARLVRKLYLCRTEGVPEPREATLSSTIAKDSKKNKSTVGMGGKEISTTYRVLADEGDTALLEVELHSGRSHQIRAQLAAIGHPLAGDGKYGARPRPGGQELTAYRLIFKIKTGPLGYLYNKEIKLEEFPI